MHDGKADVFNVFFNSNTDEQKKSFLKLKKLENIDYIFTAHYGYSDDFIRVFEDGGRLTIRFISNYR